MQSTPKSECEFCHAPFTPEHPRCWIHYQAWPAFGVCYQCAVEEAKGYAAGEMDSFAIDGQEVEEWRRENIAGSGS